MYVRQTFYLTDWGRVYRNSILHCRCNISLLKIHSEIITVKMIVIIIIIIICTRILSSHRDRNGCYTIKAFGNCCNRARSVTRKWPKTSIRVRQRRRGWRPMEVEIRYLLRQTVWAQTKHFYLLMLVGWAIFGNWHAASRLLKRNERNKNNKNENKKY